MILFFISFFVVPWILGIFLCSRNKKVVLLIAPVSAAISSLVNSTGEILNLWSLSSGTFNRLSLIILDFGAYAVMPCYLIYFIMKGKINRYFLIIAFTLFTTLGEVLFAIAGKASYNQSWNTAATFFSYLLSYLLVYRYYLALKKAGVIL